MFVKTKKTDSVGSDFGILDSWRGIKKQKYFHHFGKVPNFRKFLSTWLFNLMLMAHLREFVVRGCESSQDW